MDTKEQAVARINARKTITRYPPKIYIKDDYAIAELRCGSLFKMDISSISVAEKCSWSISNTGYAVTAIKSGKLVFFHRTVIDVNSNQFIDHINGDKLDNRSINLRACSFSENIRNFPKKILCKSTSRFTSRFKGVQKLKSGNFHSRICFNKKRQIIGTFKTEEEAAIAYNKKAKELFGEFARLNVIENEPS